MNESKQMGDHITLQLDWNNRSMQMCDASLSLHGVCPTEPLPFSPILYALESILKKCPPDSASHCFVIDATLESDTLSMQVHCTDDFQSVVNVAHARVKSVLKSLLTCRETEIAIELFEGSTIRYIAVKLKIAEGTVKKIIYNIYQKLNVASQVELIRKIYTLLAQIGTPADVCV
jgi:DNA-binding NarL/FixJ family response regulator